MDLTRFHRMLWHVVDSYGQGCALRTNDIFTTLFDGRWSSEAWLEEFKSSGWCSELGDGNMIRDAQLGCVKRRLRQLAHLGIVGGRADFHM